MSSPYREPGPRCRAYVQQPGTIEEAIPYLDNLCQQYSRIAVTGRPGIGKSWLVNRLTQTRLPIVRSDDFVTIDWEWQPIVLTEEVNQRSKVLVEGVTVARALRHGLDVEAVLWLRGESYEKQKPGADRLGDQIDRWMQETTTNAHLYVWDVTRK